MRVRRLRGSTAVAVLAIALLVVPGTGSSAAPTSIDLGTAHARLDALNARLSVVDEAYNQAVIELAHTKLRLQLQQREAGKTQKTLDKARSLVSAASRDAYIEGANPTMVLMSARDLVTLTDGLDFLDTLSAQNADRALRASIAGRRAARAQKQLHATLSSQNATLQHLATMRAELQQGVSQTQSLLQQIQQATFPRPRPAVSRSFLRAPAAPGHGAQVALNAAYSVLGTPYRYAGASPSEGFDCSGLTMWSWAHAGVSLPHSAQAQYDSIPHVSRGELQPGDLVFFYSPISHVGMYVGNGRMIEAPHTGDVVKVTDVYWDSYVGGGRPGV